MTGQGLMVRVGGLSVRVALRRRIGASVAGDRRLAAWASGRRRMEGGGQWRWTHTNTTQQKHSAHQTRLNIKNYFYCSSSCRLPVKVLLERLRLV